MKVLDLFCGVGGASAGYEQAGHDVVGVDIRHQPHYPYAFHWDDALEFPLDGFDLVHASPPCQRFSTGAASWGTSLKHPDLIGPIRERLIQWGGPYVIENIPLAPLRDPVMLCGDQFGLGVFRHRNFETSFPATAPKHQRHTGRIGDGRFFTVAGHCGGSSSRDGWTGGSLSEWQKAMGGINWANSRELAQAIPPAYTKFIAEQIQ